MRPLLDGRADAVFGSRYLAGGQTRVLPFWHSVMNRTLTLLSNMFCNLNLTDMETCYKVFRTDLLKSIPIRSDRFGFEPEITMKCAKRKLRIYEVAHQLPRSKLRRGQEDRLVGTVSRPSSPSSTSG